MTLLTMISVATPSVTLTIDANKGSRHFDINIPNTGGQVVLTGPPNATVEIHIDGKTDGQTSVQLDGKGKAVVPIAGPPRSLTLFITGDLDSAVTLEVIDPHP